jgi:hypothetical protein
MKPITFYFLVAQLLDLCTTGVGLLLGLWETNPVGINLNTIISKLLVILLGVIIFSRLKMPKLAWIIVIISAIPVLWNLLVITCELLV